MRMMFCLFFLPPTAYFEGEKTRWVKKAYYDSAFEAQSPVVDQKRFPFSRSLFILSKPYGGA